MLYPTAGAYFATNLASGETLYKCGTSPTTQPNTIRLAYQQVTDIFKGNPQGLTPASGQSVVGSSVLVQVREVWKVDDAGDTLAPIYLPVSAHMVLRLPTDDLVDAAAVGGLVKRLVGAVYRNGTDAITVAYGNVMRGITEY